MKFRAPNFFEAGLAGPFLGCGHDPVPVDRLTGQTGLKDL
jgi:hypothetical protein